MKRALLVIDVQNEYDSGALPIVHPPLPDALAAVARARAAGIPVVLARQTNPADAPAFAQGSPRWELHPTLGDGDGDKALPSACSGTGLDSWLRERGIEVLTVGGFLTQNCVDATVRDAVHRGYAVEVTSHVFRKTVATFMDQAGLSNRAPADQLGHANTSMTTDVCSGRKVRKPAPPRERRSPREPSALFTLPGRLRGVHAGSPPSIPAAQRAYETMTDDLERARTSSIGYHAGTVVRQPNDPCIGLYRESTTHPDCLAPSNWQGRRVSQADPSPGGVAAAHRRLLAVRLQY